YLHNRADCVPIACSDRHTQAPVDLVEEADCLHLPPVETECVSALDGDDPQKPFVIRRKIEGKGGQHAGPFCQHAHEPNCVRAGGLTLEWGPRLNINNVSAATDHDMGFEWQSPKQFSPQPCLTYRLPDHKGPGRAHVDHT